MTIVYLRTEGAIKSFISFLDGVSKRSLSRIYKNMNRVASVTFYSNLPKIGRNNIIVVID